MNDNIKFIVNKKQIIHAGITVGVIVVSFLGGYQLGRRWGVVHPKIETDNSVDYLAKSDYFNSNTFGDSANADSVSVEEKRPKDLYVNREEGVAEQQQKQKLNNQSEEVLSEKKNEFVASKNGTKFYPVDCKSADRIKEENKVYFSTKDEAIKAGLEEATSC